MKFITFIDNANRLCSVNVDNIAAIVESRRGETHCYICLSGSDCEIIVQASLEEVLGKISNAT